MSNSLKISSAAVSDRGLSEKRPQNEDSYLEMSQIGIFAVADGVGGAQAGEVASQMAMEILGEAFANLSSDADAETVMRTAIESANAAIYEMAHELPQLSNMATTIVALHLAENIATIGHVGDSRLYRVDRDGNLHRDTDDHSMVAEEVRAGRMTEEQAENHPSRNIISRALGAEPTVDVEIKTIMAEPGTSFLACSDGITRHVTDDEIKGVLTFGGDPGDVCEYLKSICYERGAEDNLTAVVVKVSAAKAGASGAMTGFVDADDEILTIASARSPFEDKIADDEDEPDLLELDTHEITISNQASSETKDAEVTEGVIPIADSEPATESLTASEVQPVAVQDTSETSKQEAVSTFGSSFTAYDDEEKPSSVGKIALAAGLLLLGMVIGLGFYQLFLVPASPVANPPLSEMKSANIPQSAFEENRRDVDKDPAGYLQKNSAPQDAEDYYLVGRAYMLTGDFPKAHTAFVEARNRLAEADPANARVLKNDIAMSIAVTNDTTIQKMLTKEFDTIKPSANANR